MGHIEGSAGIVSCVKLILLLKQFNQHLEKLLFIKLEIISTAKLLSIHHWNYPFVCSENDELL